MDENVFDKWLKAVDLPMTDFLNRYATEMMRVVNGADERLAFLKACQVLAKAVYNSPLKVRQPRKPSQGPRPKTLDEAIQGACDVVYELTGQTLSFTLSPLAPTEGTRRLISAFNQVRTVAHKKKREVVTCGVPDHFEMPENHLRAIRYMKTSVVADFVHAYKCEYRRIYGDHVEDQSIEIKAVSRLTGIIQNIKYGIRPRKRKVPAFSRDPNRPKNVRSAFTFYNLECAARVKAGEEGIPSDMKTRRADYERLEDKTKYIELYEQDSERFKDEFDEYQQIPTAKRVK